MTAQGIFDERSGDVTDKIGSVMTQDDWKEFWRDVSATRATGGSPVLVVHDGDPRNQLPQIIARANALLPDSDPRKITHVLIARLRVTAEHAGGPGAGPTWLADLADALESYLPPEGT
jgi:hypothetical protein